MGQKITKDKQRGEMKEYFYRYDYFRVSKGCDEWGNPYPGHGITLYQQKYEVLKHTPKGTWIILGWDGYVVEGNLTPVKRFVLRDATKRYACPTIKEALESFKYRKIRQKSLLNDKIEDINIALRKADDELRKVS